ncbi:L protein [Mecsek Mountains virus]|uniref:RNA-directed RNA polymerase L n=1 Tax=Mecsek Mountains virus TaxID=3036599 RepID=A0A9Y1MB11_9VIRU|nr:L protein [Mecsek Mountains virus]
MEDLLKEIKDLIVKNFPHLENLSRQKLALLSQREPKFVLIEGLKLLSMLIEIDSCTVHNCIHNFEDLTVEQIVLNSGRLCPSLPFVTPDGYRLIGDNLILLECFVRASPASFEQKFKEDSVKLQTLKTDLTKIGINLIPLIDGRSNYVNQIVPDWVVQRLKYLLIKLTEFEQENTEILEQAEYERLIESLRSKPENSLGIENLNVLSDQRTDYYNELITILVNDVNNNLSSLDIEIKISQIYNEFRNKLNSGEITRHLVLTDKVKLLKEFNDLYDIELSSKDYYHEESLFEIVNKGLNSNQLTKIAKYYDGPHVCQLRKHPIEIENSLTSRVLSLLNKVKSLKVLNTHRNALLNFDMIILNVHVYLNNTYPNYLESKEWTSTTCGGSIMSVNDRLISVEVTIQEYLNKLKRILKMKGSIKELEDLHQEIQRKFKTKIKAKLREVNISENVFSVTLDSIKVFSLTEIEKFCSVVPKILPKIVYNKENKDFKRDQDHINKRTEEQFISSTDEEGLINLDFEKLFENVSSLCLSLCNSMKTSSICKLRQNAATNDRYKVVTCKECFAQPLMINGFECYLIYQKTGESSKCYSLCDNNGHFASFYADPKRFFLPIFSNKVLINMVDIMMTWISGIPNLSSKLKEIRLAMLTLILLIICNPSKRVQKLLQNYRYYIMAYVNSFHLYSLLDKLKEVLITDTEYHIFRLLNWLNKTILDVNIDLLLTNRFKFLLNVSYLCHLITKETPDRNTDLIKCFEKFLNPKLENDFITVNGHDKISTSEQLFFKTSIKNLFEKDILKNNLFGTPGVNREVFSLMISCFNLGLLQTLTEKENLKNPLKIPTCATVMDLASNKSVVKPRVDDVGEKILDYEFNKVVATSIYELAEVFKKKGRHQIDHKEYEFKIMSILTDLVLKKESMAKDEKEQILLDDLSENQLDFVRNVSSAVELALSNISNRSNGEVLKEMKRTKPDISHLYDIELKPSYVKLIKSEVSCHTVSDFARDLLPEEVYESICHSIKSHPTYSKLYFTEMFVQQCPISDITKNLAQKYYESFEFFECFKFLLLQMNCNNMTGRFEHDKHKTVGFKKDFNEVFSDTKISDRESNSQAISEALSLTDCVSSALKNLCFYSNESPKSYTSVGPDTGRLKFGLSYKEQVGGNRELYIGDLRTKMFTRLLEDYFESLTRSFKTSCLNDEGIFEDAILSMKLNVRQGWLTYSMDHSKWGPMMSPAIFASMLLNMRLPIDWQEECGREQIVLLLMWHIHKLVEVPVNVVIMMMKSYIKKNLGLLPEARTTMVEDFFSESFQRGIIPSHISSVIDMGQGILHNTSDFYGLITERFINYVLKKLLNDGSIIAFTSSDDQITIFEEQSTTLSETNIEEFLNIMEFHLFLSDSLNKFVSPKSVIGKFAAEFKSRFYVWGDEVPLLTKFVSAALHNVKCKEPHQLAETIDTILDQSVANGVPLALVNLIGERTMKLLSYTNYPLDPFLMFCKSDVKDWVDGSRGYRLQRSIENICPSECKELRKVLRVFHNEIKCGRLNEEFAVNLFKLTPDEAINSLYKICEKEKHSDILKLRWLNFSEFHPLRMVLRNKVILPSQLTDKDENIPSLLKTIQSKLSKNFTRGAQKLLAEAINKSAFQSSIASGFVGLCKTMGSKCVRDQEKNTHFIKSILKEIKDSPDVGVVKKENLTLFEVTSNYELNQMWWKDLLRPVLWDYSCITLCNSFELGTWVLGEPEAPKRYNLIRDPCNYYPIKPGNFSNFEDKVNLNHVVHSIRRLFPKVFEDHLLPFISDLNVLKMKWTPRIKFLDLCVAIDMKCEALSLISHVIKWKRQEHYVVLSSDLAKCHIRESSSLSSEKVISTADICKNFIKQIFFESHIKAFMLVPSILGSFSWFPHKKLISHDENLSDLGPLRQFIEKVMLKGSILRPMYRTDITSDFMWFDINIGSLELRKATLISQTTLDFSKEFETVYHFLLDISENLRHSLTFYFQIRATIRGCQTMNPLKSTLSYSVTCEVDDEYLRSKGEFALKALNLECFMSGEIDKYLLQDILLVIKSESKLKSQENWFLDLSRIKGEVNFKYDPPDSYRVYMDLTNVVDVMLSFQEYVTIGEVWEPIPLVIDCGNVKEGIKTVAEIKVKLTNSDLTTFLETLKENRNVSQYIYLLLKNPHLETLRNVDIISVLNSLGFEVNILKEAMREVSDWREFKGYNLAYSKSKDSLLVQSSLGAFQFKGRRCDLYPKVEVIEELE